MPGPGHDTTATAPETRERGAEKDGQPQVMDRRLWMQLFVFDCVEAPPDDVQRSLAAALETRGAAAVLYRDFSNPTGLGLLAWSEDPTELVTGVRAALNEVRGIRHRHELAMLGRSYSSGFEPDLEYWLLRRPRETVL